MSWALIRSSDGEWMAGPLDAKPAAPAGQYVVTVALGLGVDVEWSKVARAFVAIVDQAALIERVRRECDQRQVTVMWTGLARRTIDAEIAREVYDYRNVVGSLLATLTTVQRRTRYPFAMAEADLTGDSLATVIGRMEADIAGWRPGAGAARSAQAACGASDHRHQFARRETERRRRRMVVRQPRTILQKRRS